MEPREKHRVATCVSLKFRSFAEDGPTCVEVLNGRGHNTASVKDTSELLRPWADIGHAAFDVLCGLRAVSDRQEWKDSEANHHPEDRQADTSHLQGLPQFFL